MLSLVKGMLGAKKPIDYEFFGTPSNTDHKIEISQIYLTDSKDSSLSPFLEHAISTVKLAFPKAHRVIYDKESLRQFIADHYESEVLWAYDKLRPYAYKADLGRYCLLNKLGGWYFDISTRIMTPVKLGEHIEFLVFREIQKHTFSSWACQNAILYSKPGNIVLQTAIKSIILNCREEYYGLNPLCPTGPALLGEALAYNRCQENYIFGDAIELTPTHEKKNRASVLPDGTILAWSKPCNGGELDALGATGVNNYNKLWHARDIYN